MKSITPPPNDNTYEVLMKAMKETQLAEAQALLGKEKAKQLIAEADRLLRETSGIRKELEDRIVELQNEVNDLRSSTSWRVTSPMRWIKNRIIR